MSFHGFDTLAPDTSLLRDLVTQRMPFGKYSGRLLADLPEDYVIWLQQRGFPAGRLGQALALLNTIQLNGLESLLHPLRR
jgi:uncharacterized protein (DUF3820 family)